MTQHYTIPDRVKNETTTLLSSDPVIWETYKQVLES